MSPRNMGFIENQNNVVHSPTMSFNFNLDGLDYSSQKPQLTKTQNIKSLKELKDLGRFKSVERESHVDIKDSHIHIKEMASEPYAFKL